MEDAGAKALETSIEMMSRIAEGLVCLRRNLSKAVALEEMEFDCMLLLFR